MTPQEFLQREEEIRKASAEFPDMEMGAAYAKWKEARGEEAVFLQAGDKSVEDAKRALIETAWKLCEKCGGKAILESICGGCVEGKKGYKSKFTCEDCLHRELSKEEYIWWLKELSSQLKESSSPSA
jgi:hypothetical protein